MIAKLPDDAVGTLRGMDLRITDHPMHWPAGAPVGGVGFCGVDAAGQTVVLFHAERLQSLANEDAQAVIAHELAHAYCGHPQLDPLRFLAMCDGDAEEAAELAEGEIEDEADEQAQAWGFKPARAELFWAAIYQEMTE